MIYLVSLFFTFNLLADPITQAPAANTQPFERAISTMQLRLNSLSTVPSTGMPAQILAGVSEVRTNDQNKRISKMMNVVDQATKTLLDPNSSQAQKDRAQRVLTKFGPIAERYREARFKLVTLLDQKTKTYQTRYQGTAYSQQGHKHPNLNLPPGGIPKPREFTRPQLTLMQMSKQTRFADNLKAKLPELQRAQSNLLRVPASMRGTPDLRVLPGTRGSGF